MERLQFVACENMSIDGELRWTQKPMERWQMAMFPVRYEGDFGYKWMLAIMAQAGMD